MAALEREVVAQAGREQLPDVYASGCASSTHASTVFLDEKEC